MLSTACGHMFRGDLCSVILANARIRISQRGCPRSRA
jgi:hypothetical protein